MECSAVVRRREDTDTSLGGSSVRVGAKKA